MAQSRQQQMSREAVLTDEEHAANTSDARDWSPNPYPMPNDQELLEGYCDASADEEYIDAGVVAPSDFARALSGVIGAAVPGPGSFSSLKLTCQLKSPPTPEGEVSTELSLKMQLARTSSGLLEASVIFVFKVGWGYSTNVSNIKLDALDAEAKIALGVEESAKLTGGSAIELAQIFQLVLRESVKLSAVGMLLPDEAEWLGRQIMGDDAAEATTRGLSGDDGASATATVSGELAASAKSSILPDVTQAGFNAKTATSFGLGVSNKDGDRDELELNPVVGVSHAGELMIAGLTVSASANVLISTDRSACELFATAGRKIQLTENMIGDNGLYLTSLVLASVSGLADLVIPLLREQDPTARSTLMEQLMLLAPTAEMVNYTPAANSLFTGDEEVLRELRKRKVEIELFARLGYSLSKGLFFSASLQYAKTTEVTDPFGILTGEISSGDTILSLEVNKSDGFSASS